MLEKGFLHQTLLAMALASGNDNPQRPTLQNFLETQSPGDVSNRDLMIHEYITERGPRKGRKEPAPWQLRILHSEPEDEICDLLPPSSTEPCVELAAHRGQVKLSVQFALKLG